MSDEADGDQGGRPRRNRKPKLIWTPEASSKRPTPEAVESSEGDRGKDRKYVYSSPDRSPDTSPGRDSTRKDRRGDTLSDMCANRTSSQVDDLESGLDSGSSHDKRENLKNNHSDRGDGSSRKKRESLIKQDSESSDSSGKRTSRRKSKRKKKDRSGGKRRRESSSEDSDVGDLERHSFTSEVRKDHKLMRIIHAYKVMRKFGRKNRNVTVKDLIKKVGKDSGTLTTSTMYYYRQIGCGAVCSPEVLNSCYRTHVKNGKRGSYQELGRSIQAKLNTITVSKSKKCRVLLMDRGKVHFV